MSAEYNLKPIHQGIIDIYLEFRKVLEKHGLKHYANGGTCIGAMRHQGFVPWDDDFDLEMLREDYDKLLSIPPSEFPPSIKMVTWRNSKDYTLLFVKIVCTDMEKVKKIEKESGLSLWQGLFIDIFPADYFPRSRIAQISRLVKRGLVRSVGFYYRNGFMGYGIKGGLIALMGLAYRLFHPRLKTLADCNDAESKIVSACPESKADMLRLSSWYKNDIHLFTGRIKMPKWVYGTPVEKPFENITIPVPEHWDEYLTAAFGDWRKFPPEDLRRPMHTYAHDAETWRFGV